MEAEAEAESIRVSNVCLNGNYFSIHLIPIHFLDIGDPYSQSKLLLLCLHQIKGEAEAFAVEAKGRAEAEQMAKKAEAFQQYKDGAMVDMLLENLPLVRQSMHPSNTTFNIPS